MTPAERAAARFLSDRAKQGLPPVVEDPAALATVGRLVASQTGGQT